MVAPWTSSAHKVQGFCVRPSDKKLGCNRFREEIDRDKIDDAVLALLWLTLHDKAPRMERF